MKRKYRSSDSYIPSELTYKSSSSSSYGGGRRSKRRKISVDYGNYRRRSSDSTSSGGLTGYTSTSSVYTGNSASRAVAGASGAVLGFIHNNVPGTVVGAKKATELYDYLNTKKVSRKKMVSSYQGNFKKPYKKAPSFMDKAQMNGFAVCSEIFGKVTDPNSVYLTHSTYQSQFYGITFACAAMRKLFEKAGFPIQNKNGSLPFFSPVDADGFKLEYTVTNPVTGLVSLQATYTTVAADTLTSVLTNFAFQVHVTNYLNKANEAMPHHLYLYSSDRNTTATNWRLAAMLDLTAEVVHFYSTSDLRVQNQSNAVNADAADTDRNDVQPLAGRLYNFNGEPKLKANGIIPQAALPPNAQQNQEILLQGVAYTGIKLLRSTDFSSASYQNRPPPQLFNNCTGVSDVSLEPGHMKRGFVSYSCKGRLNNLFPKLRMEQFGLVPEVVSGIKGKAQMMVFEERMRTASVNPVIVAYEHKVSVGCILSTRPLRASLAMINYPSALNKP